MKRLTQPRRQIFEALREASPEGLTPPQLLEITGIQSGTLYSTLNILAESPFMEAEWDIPAEGKSKPSHLYSLTAAGKTLAEKINVGTVEAAKDWRQILTQET